jgi:hypothetical protein
MKQRDLAAELVRLTRSADVVVVLSLRQEAGSPEMLLLEGLRLDRETVRALREDLGERTVHDYLRLETSEGPTFAFIANPRVVALTRPQATTRPPRGERPGRYGHRLRARSSVGL